MEKKYELTDKFIEINGTKLYRIRALRRFMDVKKGELGGYIEKESNLSHDGICWVYDNAYVYGDAWIYNHVKISNNAQVYGNASISNYARIYNNALVYGNAHISDKANIYGNSQVYGNASISNYAHISNYARIYDNALVYNNAHISGEANIYGNAQVYDDAHISGYARIYEDAHVFDNAKISRFARVSGNACVSGNSWSISPFYLQLSQHHIASPNFTDLSIGHETHSIEYWKENFMEFAKKSKYSNSEIELYVDSILMAEKYIEIAKKCYNI